jgi:hypothetical protein
MQPDYLWQGEEVVVYTPLLFGWNALDDRAGFDPVCGRRSKHLTLENDDLNTLGHLLRHNGRERLEGREIICL